MIENLLHELPPLGLSSPENPQPLDRNDVFASSLLTQDGDDAEQAWLLPGQRQIIKDSVAEDEPMSAFVGLNALEIGAITDAKKFLSQRIVQNLVVSFSGLLMPNHLEYRLPLFSMSRIPTLHAKRER